MIVYRVKGVCNILQAPFLLLPLTAEHSNRIWRNLN